jgi:hypothetical protein
LRSAQANTDAANSAFFSEVMRAKNQQLLILVSHQLLSDFPLKRAELQRAASLRSFFRSMLDSFANFCHSSARHAE